MIDLVIVGAGGTASDVLDFIDDINRRHHTYRCVGLLDDNADANTTVIAGVRILGPLAMAGELSRVQFVDALGGPASFRQRQKLVDALGISPDRFESIVHPTACLSRRSSLGQGSIIYPHVTVGANVTLGAHVLILAQSVVNHDCRVGDYTIITSGVCISGCVDIGESCYLGTGSQIIQGAIIGSRSMIGMGSVVIRNVEEDSVVAGNPARTLRSHKWLTGQDRPS